MNGIDWVGRPQAVFEQRIEFSANMATTLDNTAAADAGNGLVQLAITGHGFALGSQIYIEGSTNYTGAHMLAAVDTNWIRIPASFVAETPAGTETVTFVVAPGRDFRFISLKFPISTAPTTAESMVITLDSGYGANYDLIERTLPLVTVTDFQWIPDLDQFAYTYNPDDKIRFAYTNTDARTIALVYKYATLL